MTDSIRFSGKEAKEMGDEMLKALDKPEGWVFVIGSNYNGYFPILKKGYLTIWRSNAKSDTGSYIYSGSIHIPESNTASALHWNPDGLFTDINTLIRAKLEYMKNYRTLLQNSINSF